MVVGANISWYQARDFCEGKNAYLAHIPDTAEREAVLRYAKGAQFLIKLNVTG